MRQSLQPVWTRKQIKAGEKMRNAWEKFFSAATSPGRPGAGSGEPSLDAQVDAVLRKHEARLLAYPNVVAVASGQRMRRGRPSKQPCVTVYVERKVPRAELAPADVLPEEIEGIPVDVVESGTPKAL